MSKRACQADVHRFNAEFLLLEANGKGDFQNSLMCTFGQDVIWMVDFRLYAYGVHSVVDPAWENRRCPG